jgi:hypothetical protein
VALIKRLSQLSELGASAVNMISKLCSLGRDGARKV